MEIQVTEFSCRREGLTVRGKEYRPQGTQLRPSILCHGFNGTGADQAVYAQALAQLGYAAYCFDFCGGSAQSKSDGRFQDMTVFTEAADLGAVADYARSLPYVDEKKGLTLLGCSQGGFVCALYAAQHPQQVGHLVLFFPALCIPEDARRGQMLFYSFDPAQVPEVIAPSFPEDFPQEMRSLIKPLGGDYVTSVRDLDAFSTISAYPGPVLIVHGDGDTVVDVSYSRRALDAYNAAAPQRCQLAVLPGAGHGFTQSEDVLAMEQVQRFLVSTKQA